MDILIISNESIIVNKIIGLLLRAQPTYREKEKIMKNKKVLYSTKWIAYTAVFTALVIATGFIPPVPTAAGRIYWVDGIVLIGAYLMDPLAAFIAGGVGTLLYDLLQSPSMMLASLLIHGLQAAVVSTLIRFVLPKKHEEVWALVASLAGAVVVVAGYFIYRVVTLGTATALASIPRNVIQEVIGISIAMVLCYATTFKKQLRKQRLLPDFKREILDKGQGDGQTADDVINRSAFSDGTDDGGVE